MVWQRMLNRFAKTARTVSRKTQKRRLLLERLDSRQLMAADIGIIEGIAFTDLSGNGLTTDDPRLAGVTVQLYRDANPSDGLGRQASDLLVATATTEALSSSNPGRYRFGTDPGVNLGAGTYFVVQQPSGTLTAPAEQTVTLATGFDRVTIDRFNTTAQPTLTADSTNPTQTAFPDSPTTEVIGGERDISITRTGTTGNVTLGIEPTLNQLSFGSSSGAGTALIQYDGVDDSIALAATGLGGMSLNANETKSGVVSAVSSNPVSGSFEIRIYSSATNFSTATVNYPAGSESTTIEVFTPFSSFAPGVGATGPANFDSVGAIENRIVLVTDQDVKISLLESNTPEIEQVNLPNTQFVSLGGQVFLDNSTTAAMFNNGIRDAGEPGRDLVQVNLYRITNPTAPIDFANPTATMMTGANGTYKFENLQAGDYVVAIPSSQFATSARLFGFVTSTGNNPAPDPDNNVVGDDNGALSTATGAGAGFVVSQAITLTAGGEPDTPVDGDDTNSNMTVGFGLIPLVDLRIAKTVNTTASTINAGGTAVFDIVVENLGPSNATNVQVTDAIPTGLTFQSIASSTGGTTTFTTNGGSAGNPLIVTIGDIPSGTTQSFRIIAAIGATQTADIMNTATVDSSEFEEILTNNTSTANLNLPEADLSIAKSAVPATVNAGENVTYTIVVTNNGPDAAAGVQVTDPLPLGVTFVRGYIGADPGVGNPDTRVAFNAANRTVTANVGALANQATSTLTVIVTVPANADSPLSNTATVSLTPDIDNNPGNDQSTAPTALQRSVDVGITKTASANPVAGGIVTYTVVVTNTNGPGDARGVTVTDTLDPRLTFGTLNAGTSGVTNATVGTAPRNLIFNVGTLPVGATRTFSYTASIATSATGQIPNTAVITTTDIDTVSANNMDDEPITVGQNFDLTIDKSVNLATAVPGQTAPLIYTIVVSHAAGSVSDAANVTVRDVLPAGLSGQIISAPTATGAPTFDTTTREAVINFASIPAGETRTITITANIDAPATGSIVNPATVSAPGETITTNNSDNATTTLTPDFDVTVTKTTTSTNVGPSDTVTYTIGVSKSGPSQANNVTFTDAIPTGLTFVSGTLNGVAVTNNSGTLTVPQFNLANNTPITGTLTFTVNPTATGIVTNTAMVSAAGESNLNNNTASVPVTVVPRVDLRVAKTVNSATAAPNATLTYTITVTNDGPSTAAAVQAIDTLPAGVTFVSGTGPNGALSAPNAQRQITVAGGDLAANGSFTITINATVNAATTGALQNSVTVSTTTSEPNLANNTATASTTVTQPISSLSGRVYVDTNRNNVFDAGDTGQGGITVQLSGTTTAGAPVSATQVTAADGTYNFQNLAAGTYQVLRTDTGVPSNLRDSTEQIGTGTTNTPTVNDLDNMFTQVGIGENAVASNFNFALVNDPVSKRRFLASS